MLLNLLCSSTTKNPKPVYVFSEAKLVFCDPRDVGLCINYLKTWIFLLPEYDVHSSDTMQDDILDKNNFVSM